MIEIERHLMGKRLSPDECEDALYFGAHFAAVVDGVTSKTPRAGAGLTPGVIAARTLVHAISKLPAEADASAAVQFLTDFTAMAAREEGVELAAVCAIYSRFRHEVWMVGDCSALVGAQHHRHPIRIDGVLANLRAFILESCTV